MRELGFDSVAGQGMAYNSQLDQIYLAAVNLDDWEHQIRLVDTETGSTELVGSLPGQLAWMSFVCSDDSSTGRRNLVIENAKLRGIARS